MQCLAILPQYNTLCCVTVYRVASILRMITDLTIMISNVTGCFQAARLNPTFMVAFLICLALLPASIGGVELF